MNLCFKMLSITNDSSLPRLVVINSESSLSAIHLNNDDILKIIRSLNINKVHGHDNISIGIIKMIKICNKAIVKPLSIIYQNCIDSGIFLDLWKKSNIVPVHKKEDKQFYKITDQSLCYLFLEKFLRRFCSIQYLNSYNLVFSHMIYVNISFSP